LIYPLKKVFFRYVKVYQEVIIGKLVNHIESMLGMMTNQWIR
jgi:hypothetical protein